jgi:hypothetical protein
MSALPPLLLALLATPPVGIGPDLSATARPVAAPVVDVTVFEERARVRRRATLDAPAGVSAWRLPDLPGAVAPSAVRATLEAPARLLRVEAAPVERERFPRAETQRLVDALDALLDAEELDRAERVVVEGRLRFWANVAPEKPVAEAARDGRPAAPFAVDAWSKVVDALAAERIALRTRLAALDEAARARAIEREALRRELQALDLGGLVSSQVEVVVVVDAPRAARLTLTLEYAVSGTRWRPAYELRFFADEGRAELTSYGTLAQATGEAWTDVELGLSTARPDVDATLPKLLTWTLGEAREWRPVVLPRAPLALPPDYPPPSPSVTRAETAEAAASARLLARAQAWLQGDLVGEARGSRGPSASGSAPRAAPAPPPMSRTAEPSRKMAEAPMAPPAEVLEAYADEAAGAAAMAPQVSTISSNTAPATRVGLFEPPPPPLPWLPPDCPAALTGGLDHVYRTPTRVDVAPDGQEHRFPLARESLPVEVFYEATPSLAPHAFLRATVTNRSPRPILGGPVGIFVAGGFAGDGQLETTGPGGVLRLPVGADEDVRTERRVLVETRREGVFSKDDLTTYRVEIDVQSAKKRPIRVVVREPLPATANEKIEVRDARVEPKADPSNDDPRIVTWSVDVAPGKVERLALTYTVRRPADYQLFQR